jgi:hypothetical protein
MAVNMNKAALARAGIDAASTVASAGFSVAKYGTKLGVSSATSHLYTAH